MKFSKVASYPLFAWTFDKARADYCERHGIELHQVMWDYNLGWYLLWHEVK